MLHWFELRHKHKSLAQVDKEKTYALPDGDIITVAPNVSVARKGCSSHTVPVYDGIALCITPSFVRLAVISQSVDSSLLSHLSRAHLGPTEHSPIRISLNTCLLGLATKVKFRCCDSILVAFVIIWMHRQTLSLQLNTFVFARRIQLILLVGLKHVPQ